MKSSICGDLKFLVLQELSVAFRKVYRLKFLSLYSPYWWFILSWISFSTLLHFRMQGTEYYCSCVVIFCLGFSFCAPFRDQDQYNSSLLSTEYPLRDIIPPLWYSINTQWFLNSCVSLWNSDCWISAHVLFPLRHDFWLMFDFCIMPQLHFHVTLR